MREGIGQITAQCAGMSVVIGVDAGHVVGTHGQLPPEHRATAPAAGIAVLQLGLESAGLGLVPGAVAALGGAARAWHGQYACSHSSPGQAQP